MVQLLSAFLSNNTEVIHGCWWSRRKPEEGWRVKGRLNLSIVRGMVRPCRSLITLVPCREQLGGEYTKRVCPGVCRGLPWLVGFIISWGIFLSSHLTPTFHRWRYGAWEVKELAQSHLETGDTLKPRTDGPVYSFLYTNHGIILAFLLGWGLGGTGSRFSMLSLGQVHTRAFQSNGWVKSQASISQAPWRPSPLSIRTNLCASFLWKSFVYNMTRKSCPLVCHHFKVC